MALSQSNVAIIGGGIMGLCAAHALHTRGCHISLFDPVGFPAHNASQMAGGMLAPYSEIEHVDCIIKKMKILKKEQIVDFMHFASTKKRDAANWRYLYVAVQDPEQAVHIDEIMQLLGFQIKDSQSTVLVLQETNELILVTHRENTGSLSNLEKGIYENFNSNIVRAVIKGFDLEGVERLASILKPHIEEDNIPAKMAFKRMERLPNNIMVLDDDPMVLKQMEKALSGFGNFISLQNSELFFDYYQDHAPNILFLDIHLGKDKGSELLKKLTAEIDPLAHVVMISSDTMKETIVEIKGGGAKGFVVKPFNRNDLFQHMVKAPTTNIRTAASA